MTPRPALVESLARVSGVTPGLFGGYCGADLRSVVHRDRSILLCYGSYEVVLAPLAHADVEEAIEALTPDLWPWPTQGDGAPWWWCDECEGSGLVIDFISQVSCGYCGADDDPDYIVTGPGHTALPRDLAALVAVASLGLGNLLRIAATADLIAPRAQLVLRVATAVELDRHHGQVWSRVEGTAEQLGLLEVFSGEALNVGSDPKYAPFGHLERDYGADHETAPHWAAMGALFELSAHLLDVPREGSPGRVVIGLPAVGTPARDDDGERDHDEE